MLTSLADVHRLFPRAHEVRLPGSPHAAFTWKVEGDPLAAWREARQRLPQTGRWPVVVERWSSLTDLFDRFEYESTASPEELVEQGRQFEAARFHAKAAEEADAELRAERTGTPLEPAPDGPSALDWFAPSQPYLVLLPVPDGWNTLAYLHWYEQKTVEYLAVLRDWHERFGAELVCHYGTMLQFVVSRPPQTAEEAWQLAWEQALVAPCTRLLPGLTLQEFAQELLGRSTWFLHERP